MTITVEKLKQITQGLEARGLDTRKLKSFLKDKSLATYCENTIDTIAKDYMNYFLEQSNKPKEKPKRLTHIYLEVTLDEDTNTHTVSDITDKFYEMLMTKDYLDNKWSNLPLKDAEGYAIGRLKVNQVIAKGE